MNTILIETDTANLSGQTVTINASPVYYISGQRYEDTIYQTSHNGLARWEIASKEPILVSSELLFESISHNIYLEPGDSIHVENKNGTTKYTGRGSEKLTLIQKISDKLTKLQKPSNPNYYTTKSLQDYLEWNSYLNIESNITTSLLDEAKPNLTVDSYQFLKQILLAKIEHRRIFKFDHLREKAEVFGIKGSSLCNIFDSTLNNEVATWLRSIREQVNFDVYYYQYVRTLYNRQHGFTSDKEVKISPKRKLSYYELAKKVYQGELLDQYYAFLIPKEVLKEEGYTSSNIKLLKDFYSGNGNTSMKYVKYVRKAENDLISTSLIKGNSSPNFELTDAWGMKVSKVNLLGKITIMMFPGSEGKENTAYINKIKEQFKQNDLVKIWSILDFPTTDQDSTEILFAGENYETIKRIFNITSVPAVHIINQNGKTNSTVYPSGEDSSYLYTIKHNVGAELTPILHDGPYILLRKDSIEVISIDTKKATSQKYAFGEKVSFKARTDKYEELFDIHLEYKHQPPPSVFEMPEELVVLSDIEGNFSALRKLLEANRIIDKNMNWTFGKNHLILNGDIVDRGNQVTECLWLIYALEQKAKKSGGHVHFILGNHEILNLNKRNIYANSKYIRNASLIKIPYAELYSERTEIGKWLRTKNIMEKIGNYLFVHGGISPEMNTVDLPIHEINNLARKYYSEDSTAIASSDRNLKTIFNYSTSPFWFRKYYREKEKNMDVIIHNTLHKFDVKKIVTGHTIVADHITQHYDGKVINTDTRHSKGKSEALLIKNYKLYRIDTTGKQYPL
ncbi:metallophosphoesterase [Chitinophaga sp. XS-30]|uniref:metallophosphoesterase n=1 Tax=Chitinophaga sp. XS-30 TaxID=2604421 RepID=UPI00143DA480|nr:metallophosphoesterase [Chitinophaga sp. XS-30]